MGVCAVCKGNEAKYTCPRCSTGYCSAACYKQHNLPCTEAFYKELVETELKTNKLRASKEQRHSMAEILQRIHQGKDGDGPAPQDFFEDEKEQQELENAEVLAHKAETGELTLADLSERDRAAFFAAVSSGRLANLVEPWTPFWEVDGEGGGGGGDDPVQRGLSKEAKAGDNIDVGAADAVPRGGPLIEEIGNESDNDNGDHDDGIDDEQRGHRNAAAALPFAFPTLPELLPDKAASIQPAVAFRVLDVLYTYTTVSRYFDGDWSEEPELAWQCLTSISSVLTGSVVYPTPVQALQHVLARGLACATMTLTREFCISTLRDAAAVGRVKEWTLRVLGEVALLCNAMADGAMGVPVCVYPRPDQSKGKGKGKGKGGSKGKGGASKETRRALMLAGRAVLFLGAWVQSHHGMLEQCCADADSLHAVLVEQLREDEKINGKQRGNNGGGGKEGTVAAMLKEEHKSMENMKPTNPAEAVLPL